MLLIWAFYFCYKYLKLYMSPLINPVNSYRLSQFYSCKNILTKEGVVVHRCNLSVLEAETGRFRVQGQQWLHRKLKGSLGYITASKQNKNQNNNNKTKTNVQKIRK